MEDTKLQTILNRQIKFRAWDKENKRIVYFGLYSLLVDGVEKDEYWLKHYKAGLRNLEIIQYTGLKDKNGIEIYFGDILATSNKDKQYDIWNKKDFGYTVVVEEKDILGVSYSNWWIEFDGESVYDISFVEVIGNIHENKNLLK